MKKFVVAALDTYPEVHLSCYSIQLERINDAAPLPSPGWPRPFFSPRLTIRTGRSFETKHFFAPLDASPTCNLRYCQVHACTHAAQTAATTLELPNCQTPHPFPAKPPAHHTKNYGQESAHSRLYQACLLQVESLGPITQACNTCHRCVTISIRPHRGLQNPCPPPRLAKHAQGPLLRGQDPEHSGRTVL